MNRILTPSDAVLSSLGLTAIPVSKMKEDIYDNGPAVMFCSRSVSATTIAFMLWGLLLFSRVCHANIQSPTGFEEICGDAGVFA